VRVVIFKFNHLGDNVVFVPVIQALRRCQPDWQLTVLTTPNEAELYGGPLGAQEVLVSPKRAFDKSYLTPWVLASWILRIRRRAPDACLVAFDQGSTAHLVAKMSGAGVRIGGNNAHLRVSDSLTEEVPLPSDQRPVTWNWKMGRSLVHALGGTAPWPEKPPPPDLHHLYRGEPRGFGSSKRVVIHAGASKYLNQWSPENFGAVATALSKDYQVIWISHGGTTGKPPRGTIAIPVCSIGELSEWLAGADLFLGNNSGPMHLANAIGCHGVVVTGPSAAGWDPYWNKERWTVLRHPGLLCAPCELPDRELAGCVNSESPMACLKYFTPRMVEAACRARLETPGSGPP
jgi:ADP-heptose:LPS heptosyltransferase